MAGLKILHVAPHLRQGGAERLLFELATHPSDGVTHHVALMQDEVFFDRAGLSVEDLGFDLTRRFGALTHLPASRRGLRALIERLKPDVVQGWLYYGAFLSLAVAARARLVWSIHNTTFPRLLANPQLHLVDRVLAARSRAVPDAIVYCAASARAFHEAHGYAPERGLVIDNGVDLTRFRADAERRATRRAALGLSDDAFAVLLSARNDPQKDLPNCLDAFALFRREAPEARLLLAGRGMDDSDAGLRAMIAARGLGPVVLSLGAVADMPGLLDAADAVLLGSRYGEAMPMALLEALAMGKPIAATRVGDVGRLPCPPEALAPPADPQALAAALTFSSVGDPRWTTSFAEARAQYGLGTMTRAYEALYRSLAEQRRAP
ncbi:glycosyltransferase [Bosea sp. F3-2]|uniref:glycosyltransferase n=1 Tax=Bosea sp. F3-2 TaxID=2599640 RepID=UPI0011EF6123|nr:glycosyltransferase [Bosea sp. F3-2]QEL23963.1 glycosyltransferase [Bosea sp. F3-2]